MAERTYRREQLEQPLRITAAADERRLSRRWAGAEQRELQLHYHRVARRWLERRARRRGWAPIAGTDYTTVEQAPMTPGLPIHEAAWGELRGRVRIQAWRPEDGQPAPATLELTVCPPAWGRIRADTFPGTDEIAYVDQAALTEETTL